MQGSLLCQNFVNIKMNWSEKMRVKVPKNGIESCKLTAKKNSARKHSPCSPYTWTFYLIALRHWPFSDVRRLFFAISFYILFQFLRSLFFFDSFAYDGKVERVLNEKRNIFSLYHFPFKWLLFSQRRYGAISHVARMELVRLSFDKVNFNGKENELY